MTSETLKEQLDAWSSDNRWAGFLRGDAPKGATRYPFSHRLCKIHAEAEPPRHVGHTVTAFSGWVYSLHPLSGRNQGRLDMGKAVERAVSEDGRAKAARIRPAPTPPTRWELIHEDKLDGRAPSLSASALRVGGRALHGVPDLVYRHTKTEHVVIVERKATSWGVPSDGWPNLRAQLWAYSHIDQWARAPKITLVGEVWADNAVKPRRKAVLHWTTEDERFMSESAELFAIYADHCERMSAS